MYELVGICERKALCNVARLLIDWYCTYDSHLPSKANVIVPIFSCIPCTYIVPTNLHYLRYILTASQTKRSNTQPLAPPSH